MFAIYFVLKGCMLAFFLTLFPLDAPPHLWWGVLGCFIAAPFIGYLEHIKCRCDQQARAAKVYQEHPIRFPETHYHL